MIRLARNADGPAIRTLLKNYDYDTSALDFDDIAPWWFVYERADEILGCVMFVPSKPYAFLNDLVVRPDKILKGIGARLYLFCEKIAHVHRCKGILGYVNMDNELQRGHAIKRGYTGRNRHLAYLLRLK